MAHPAVKAFRGKGVRNIHTSTGEESVRKREVTNSLPQAVLVKKAQPKVSALLCRKHRKAARKGGSSMLLGRSEVIRTPGILLPNLSGTFFLLIYSVF